MPVSCIVKLYGAYGIGLKFQKANGEHYELTGKRHGKFPKVFGWNNEQNVQECDATAAQ